ncbi:NF038122 family metalloprotease [Cerasicoccus arenae]|uniref:PEP-CTERM protein-sorting domain-containing protein n=1 Tax=Cerasicoccus arenae TaxID=424488 RepID=A0A8J3DFF7_9BACT|nr:NF038122 family metalloprotease [Cerasicoccus arenae]MBK1859754.1 NF038122 family metalloprotease [Cerasicoccus arenae]GHB93629.1 hypothetical protein GCM10007047_06400 [Cerasicoccus arenae]
MTISKSTILIGASLLLTNLAHAELNFNFQYGSNLTALQSTDPALYAKYTGAIQEAANNWSAQFNDSMTVNLSYDIKPGTSSLASTYTNYTTAATTNVRYWMQQDETSERDAIALQNLPIQAGFMFTSNLNGNSAVRGPVNMGVTAINSSMLVSRANAKALGMLAGDDAASDGRMDVSTGFDWDFDRSDGIQPGLYDIVGTLMHEIGHALGFLSGVVNVDSAGVVDPSKIWARPLDFFRQSLASMALAQSTSGVFKPVADFAWGNPVVNNIQRDVFFSYDGGATQLAQFAVGPIHGLGSADHWFTSSEVRLMNSNLAAGVLTNFTPDDIAAFDVIGFDVVPEPAHFALLAGGLALGLMAWRRRRTNLIV